MSRKIGFWSVFQLVTVSQFGSGLLIPANLAPYGMLGLTGWLFSSAGAILLALMFALLCIRYPTTGGPQAYVHKAFGPSAAFFTGWTYWIISWVSTTAIVTSAVAYLTPLIGEQSMAVELLLEFLIIIGVTAVNLRGAYSAGNTNFLLVAFKILPLLLVPVIALFYFDKANITTVDLPLDVLASDMGGSPLNNVLLLTFWGFIGFESATACAENVKDPARVFPKALVLGTLFVAVVYFISSLGIMGVIPAHILMNSEAPYTDAAKILFGGHWYLLISLIGCIVCIAAVNAWTLASGQIASDITKDRLVPRFFSKPNKHGAPVFALIFSCLGTLPLIYFTHSDNLAQKVNTIIDLSVTSFLFVYVICCLAFLKIIWQQKRVTRDWQWYIGLLSLGFCLWVMCTTPLKTLIICSLFVLSGLPIYLIRRKKLKVAMGESLFQNSPSPLVSDT